MSKNLNRLILNLRKFQHHNSNILEVIQKKPKDRIGLKGLELKENNKYGLIKRWGNILETSWNQILKNENSPMYYCREIKKGYFIFKNL